MTRQERERSHRSTDEWAKVVPNFKPTRRELAVLAKDYSDEVEVIEFDHWAMSHCYQFRRASALGEL